MNDMLGRSRLRAMRLRDPGERLRPLWHVGSNDFGFPRAGNRLVHLYHLDIVGCVQRHDTDAAA